MGGLKRLRSRRPGSQGTTAGGRPGYLAGSIPLSIAVGTTPRPSPTETYDFAVPSADGGAAVLDLRTRTGVLLVSPAIRFVKR
jgi:hypothetical protein